MELTTGRGAPQPLGRRVRVLYAEYQGKHGRIIALEGGLWLVALDEPDDFGQQVVLALEPGQCRLLDAPRNT